MDMKLADMPTNKTQNMYFKYVHAMGVYTTKSCRGGEQVVDTLKWEAVS